MLKLIADGLAADGFCICPGFLANAGIVALARDARANRSHFRPAGVGEGARRALQLGLFDFECHFALYPPGAGYRRHLDRFTGRDSSADEGARVLSCVLYLNREWGPEDRGQLRLYRPGVAPLTSRRGAARWSLSSASGSSTRLFRGDASG
jgi:hypothetical protein